MPHTILRLPAVKARTGLSRSTIYQRISEGTFPEPISLGTRAVGWIEEEVDDWLSHQIASSRKAALEMGGNDHDGDKNPACGPLAGDPNASAEAVPEAQGRPPDRGHPRSTGHSLASRTNRRAERSGRPPRRPR